MKEVYSGFLNTLSRGDLATQVLRHHLETKNVFYGHRDYELLIPQVGKITLFGNSFAVSIVARETPRDIVSRLSQL